MSEPYRKSSGPVSEIQTLKSAQSSGVNPDAVSLHVSQLVVSLILRCFVSNVIFAKAWEHIDVRAYCLNSFVQFCALIFS
jgi:hypothetical protein